MKKVRIEICVLILVGIVCGQVFGGQRIWSAGSAHLLPKGRKEIGFFQPYRYGLSGTTEISTYKLFTVIMPNVVVKIARNNRWGWNVATRHGFIYATPLLRRLQSPLGMELGEPDKFALISPEFDIPQMVSIYNEILATRTIRNGAQLTVKGGLGLAIVGGELERSSTIDLPLIFPRLSVYYNKAVLRVGADMVGTWKGHWSYLIDYDLFLMPGGHEVYAFEHKGLIFWTKSDRFRLLLGYKLVAGEYPFGTQAHLFPILDLQWGR